MENAEVQSPARQPESHQIKFSGDSWEYFRIWAVNFLLTIVTLGIFSPWAKVRNRQYIYRNSRLAEGGFDYHADPIAILKGRILLTILFFAYTMANGLQSKIGIFIFLVGAILFPWLMVRSSIFNYRNTSYRQVRMAFLGRYKEAYKTYAFAAFITVITLGLGTVYFMYRHRKFIADHVQLSANRFQMGRGFREFINVTYKWSIIFGVPLFLLAVVLPLVMLGTKGALFIVLAIYPIMYIVGCLVKAGMYVATVDRLKFSVGEFRCHFSTFQLAKIMAVNGIAMLVSLGFLTPWATIRKLRFVFANSEVYLQDPSELDRLEGARVTQEGAIADTFADTFDFDISL